MDYKKFLRTIAQIESSGGKNTKHKEVESGIQAGSSAYGKYGLMPNTIRELANSEYGDHLPSQLREMSDEELKGELIRHPELEEVAAKALYNKITSKGITDPREEAYMWNAGHNLTQDQLAQRDIASYPYVQKFLQESKDPDLEKQLMIEDASKNARQDFKRVSNLYDQQREEPEIPFEDEDEDTKVAQKN
jgi:hypothetical protein